MEELERLPRDQLKRFIVCGGRDYNDKEFLRSKLLILLETDWMFILVHGACRGADVMAAEWGEDVKVIVEPHPADWKKYGNLAGMIRNQEMLDAGADGVIAFAGGVGTAGMIKLAIASGVPVWDLRGEE